MKQNTLYKQDGLRNGIATIVASAALLLGGVRSAAAQNVCDPRQVPAATCEQPYTAINAYVVRTRANGQQDSLRFDSEHPLRTFSYRRTGDRFEIHTASHTRIELINRRSRDFLSDRVITSEELRQRTYRGNDALVVRFYTPDGRNCVPGILELTFERPPIVAVAPIIPAPTPPAVAPSTASTQITNNYITNNNNNTFVTATAQQPVAPAQPIPVPVRPVIPLNPLQSYGTIGAGIRKECLCGDDAGLLNPAFNDELFGPYAELDFVKRLGNSRNVFRIHGAYSLANGDRTRPNPIPQSTLSGALWEIDAAALIFPSNNTIGALASGEFSGLQRTERFQNPTADFPGFSVTRTDFNYALGMALGKADRYAALSIGRSHLSNSQGQRRDYTFLRAEANLDGQLRANHGPHAISAGARFEHSIGNNTYSGTSIGANAGIDIMKHVELTGSYTYSQTHGSIMPTIGEEMPNTSTRQQHVKDCVATLGVKIHWR